MDPPRLQAKRRSTLSSTSQGYPKNSDFIPTPVISRRASIETQRLSFESRFSGQSTSPSYSSGFGSSPSQSFVSSPRTSYDSAVYGYSHEAACRPIPSRIVSWDGNYYGPERLGTDYGKAQRPRPLMRPQRLSAPATMTIVPRLRNKPGEAFRKLPKKVLDIVCDNLRNVHLDSEEDRMTCSTCLMRDLSSLALVSRQCFSSAQWRLYERIWLVGADSSSHIKKFKLKAGARLRLLRRTLRENQYLAKHVRELKFPDLYKGSTQDERESYLDLVASVIMACPSLERVLGLNVSYNYQYTRLFHALSTRTRLTEHRWDIVNLPVQLPQSLKRHNSIRSEKPSIPVLEARFQTTDKDTTLSFDQANEFMNSHDNWENLTTLVVHCASGATIDPSVLSFSISKLPALLHLSLSSIPHLSSRVLTDLPPLTSLHLSDLPAISSQALSTFATTTQATTLTSFSLSHCSLTSLPILARLLSNLISLEKFTFIQDASPSLPIGTSIFLHPYLASATLRTLTWDILTPAADESADATVILSKAIQAGGLPNLRKIKAPCDYDGVIQSLCKPLERAASPLDTALVQMKPHCERKDSGIDGIRSSTSSSSSSHSTMELSRSLRFARLAAQSRLEAARLKPRFRVIIEDFTVTKSPQFVAVFEVGAFLGKVGRESKIVYDLSEDVEGKDEAGVQVEDLLAKREKLGVEGKGFCDGSWNKRVLIGGKKDKRKLWEHREREKWKPMETSMLF